MDSKISVRSKELIFKEGDPAIRLYLIKSGEVMCLKASKDRLIPIFLAKAGDIIGENAMIDGPGYGYTAIASDTTEMIHIPSENLKGVLEQGPIWLSELSSVMINRFQTTANLIAENRIVHGSILSEDQFTSALEVEFKKIIKASSKTE